MKTGVKKEFKMNVLLHPSLLETYRFLGAAAVIFAAAIIYHRMIKKGEVKKQEK